MSVNHCSTARKDVTPTEAGERLLSYARRLLSLPKKPATCWRGRARKARSSSASPKISLPTGWQRATFSRSHPGLRLDVRADQSVYLQRDLERSELDLALLKRDAGRKGAIAVWPERVHWTTSKSHPRHTTDGPVPLIGFPTGCLYRARAIHALESVGRAWHIVERCRIERPHSPGDRNPGRPSRADRERWF
jgi:DNA-binding transcriptional LysR family regulator